MTKIITYIVLDRHELPRAIQATCSGDFERVIHLCPGWQAARALIRDYTNWAAGGLIVCMFPAWHGARRYERKITPAKKEPPTYPLPLAGWESKTMSEKEIIASWDNEYGVDWHILRPMVTKALRNKTGYLTVKVTHNGCQAQLFFEQTTEGDTKPAPSPKGGEL